MVDIDALEREYDLDHKVLRFDLSTAKTPKGAAGELARRLRTIFSGPDEVHVLDLDATERAYGDRAWTVLWEAGPFEWAVRWTLLTHDRVHADLHNSYSVTFYPN